MQISLFAGTSYVGTPCILSCFGGKLLDDIRIEMKAEAHAYDPSYTNKHLTSM